MKFLLVVLMAVLAVATASYVVPRPRPPPRPLPRRVVPYPQRPFPQSPDDEYAASLAGAPLGLYEKRQGTFYGPRGGSYSSGSEAYGLSLGNAKVGLYGKEQRQPWPITA